MGQGGSVHSGMLGVLNLAKPVEFSAEPDTCTAFCLFRVVFTAF